MLDRSFKAAGFSVDTNYKDLSGGSTKYLQQTICVFAQGRSSKSYSSDKVEMFNAKQAGDTYGYGSPMHLAMDTIFNENGGPGAVKVYAYPLQAPTGSPVAATCTFTATIGTITKTTYATVSVSGYKSQEFSIVVGETATTLHTKIAAAINAVQKMPVTAVGAIGACTCTAKWAGTSGNDIKLAISADADCGVTFVLSNPTNGTLVPDLVEPLAKMADEWDTFIVNGAGIADATLTAYAAFAETRWDRFNVKPLSCVLSAQVTVDVSTAILTTTNRKLERGNVIIDVPGDYRLPVVLAAGTALSAAKVANANPAMDYRGQYVAGAAGGKSSEYWTPQMRDTAVKAGLATVEKFNNLPGISDLITCYHPDTEDEPGYRYVNNIVKLQQVHYNVNRAFNNSDWYGAILIGEDDVSDNPMARQPSYAKTVILQVIKNLILDGILVDYNYSKAGLQVNWVGPRRGEFIIPVKLSSNGSIIAIDLNFGFNYAG